MLPMCKSSDNVVSEVEVNNVSVLNYHQALDSPREGVEHIYLLMTHSTS